MSNTSRRDREIVRCVNKLLSYSEFYPLLYLELSDLEFSPFCMLKILIFHQIYVCNKHPPTHILQLNSVQLHETLECITHKNFFAHIPFSFSVSKETLCWKLWLEGNNDSEYTVLSR